MRSVTRAPVLIAALFGLAALPATAQNRLAIACKNSTAAHTVVADIGQDDIATRIEVDGRQAPLLPTDRIRSADVGFFCGPMDRALSVLRANQDMNEGARIRDSAPPTTQTPVPAAATGALQPRVSGLRQGGGFEVPAPPQPGPVATAERLNFIGEIARAWGEGGAGGVLRLLTSPAILLTLAAVAGLAFLLGRGRRRP